MQFILFCVTLDLSNNLTEMRIVKNLNDKYLSQANCDGGEYLDKRGAPDQGLKVVRAFTNSWGGVEGGGSLNLMLSSN